MRLVGITRNNNQGVIRKEVAALEALFSKEVDAFVRSYRGVYLIVTKNVPVPLLRSTAYLNIVFIQFQ